HLSFLLLLPPPSTPTLFPYTTLFRSKSYPWDLRRICAPGFALPARGYAASPCGSGIGDIARHRSEEPGGAAASTIECMPALPGSDRKSTRLNSSHVKISYAVFCLKKK